MRDIIGLPWGESVNYQQLDIPEAWVPVVRKLNDDLLKTSPNYRVVQVKEKFGGLRYYFDGGDVSPSVASEMMQRVLQAEQECDKLARGR